ncbi:MAG: thiosulfate oxidation carrier protein SoxY [Gammaproteobacteria bacterium]|nr:thiosulfate oxidation carrier protein SoxY [Gammaproteobacteria bacterium]
MMPTTFTRVASRRRALVRLATLWLAPFVARVAHAEPHRRPDHAFAQKDVAPTLRALFGRDDIPHSDLIRIGVAKLAENGAVVPVKVDVDLPHVDEIALIGTRNPVPLIGRFSFGPRTRPFVATRVKLAETSEIVAVVRDGETLLLARAAVEVTVGGCG